MCRAPLAGARRVEARSGFRVRPVTSGQRLAGEEGCQVGDLLQAVLTACGGFLGSGVVGAWTGSE